MVWTWLLCRRMRREGKVVAQGWEEQARVQPEAREEGREARWKGGVDFSQLEVGGLLGEGGYGRCGMGKGERIMKEKNYTVTQKGMGEQNQEKDCEKDKRLVRTKKRKKVM